MNAPASAPRTTYAATTRTVVSIALIRVACRAWMTIVDSTQPMTSRTTVATTSYFFHRTTLRKPMRTTSYLFHLTITHTSRMQASHAPVMGSQTAPVALTTTTRNAVSSRPTPAYDSNCSLSRYFDILCSWYRTEIRTKKWQGIRFVLQNVRTVCCWHIRLPKTRLRTYRFALLQVQ